MTVRGGRAGWITGATAAVAALALAAAGFAQDPQPGTVGGPPTNPEFHEDPKPRSEVLVIGAGRTVVGRVEVVAYDSKYGLCINLDFFSRGGSGSCGSEPNPTGKPIAIGAWGTTRSGKNRSTEISGELSPDVASVAVRARHRNGLRTPNPIVSQVDDAMAARLGQDEPFGHFVAAVRGCIEIHRFRVVAFDSAGNRLGRHRIGRGFGDFCGRVGGGGGGGEEVEGEVVKPGRPGRPKPVPPS